MIRKCPHAVMGGVARASGGEQKECTTPGTKPGRGLATLPGSNEDWTDALRDSTLRKS